MSVKPRPVSLLCVILALCLLLSCVLAAGCGNGKKTETGEPEEKTEPTTPENGTETTAPDETEKDETPGETDTAPGKTSPASPESSSEEDAVIEAALEGARSNNPDLPELEVLSVKVVDGWARVVVQPVDRSTDAASAYLKKESGRWVVFDFGTGIGPEMYPDAPAELFK